MNLHALTSNNPEVSAELPESVSEPAASNAVVEPIPVVIPVAPVVAQPLAVISAGPPQSPRAIFWQVHFLVAYYMVITVFTAWLLLNVWGGNLEILKQLGVTAEALKDPLLKTAGYMVIGSIFGSVHYQIKVLFHFFTEGKYDYRWFGKYISAPGRAH